MRVLLLTLVARAALGSKLGIDFSTDEAFSITVDGTPWLHGGVSRHRRGKHDSSCPRYLVAWSQNSYGIPLQESRETTHHPVLPAMAYRCFCFDCIVMVATK